MAHRNNIDPSLRKPRRAKGTPFFAQRNYYALGVLGISSLTYILLELWPEVRKLKKSVVEDGKFQDHPVVRERFLQARLAISGPGNDTLVQHYIERQQAKEDAELGYEAENRPQPCLKSEGTVSKYFQKIVARKSVEEEQEEEVMSQKSSSSSSSSPYKNCLSDVQKCDFNNSISDFSDFRENLPEKASVKVKSHFKQPKQTKKSTKKPTKCKSKQVSLKKYVKTGSKNLDVNPDHLQMALALSESSYQAENPQETLNSVEKVENFKKALEKYGFQCRSNKLAPEQRRSNLEDRKSSKTSRYRYLKPILYMRTEEDRSSFISANISAILNQNQSQPKLFFEKLELCTEHLKKLQRIPILLNMNNIDQCSKDTFYTKTWKFEKSPRNSGQLLKDWSQIGGRDVSPIRFPNNRADCNLSHEEIKSTQFSSNPENLETGSVTETNVEQEFTHNRCISPDLFGSDEELEICNKPSLENNSLCQPKITDVIDLCDSGDFSNINKDNTYGNLPETISNSEKSEENPSEIDDNTSNVNESLLSNVKLSISYGDLPRISIGFDVNQSNELNVTDYVTQLLNRSKVETLDETVNYSYTGVEKMDVEEAEAIKNTVSASQSGTFSRNNSSDSFNSQESIVISDDELNYSTTYCTLKSPGENYEEFDEIPSTCDEIRGKFEKNEDLRTPDRNNREIRISILPHDGILLKTSDVSPLANYDAMDTPQILQELDNFGLKPMKRQRGVHLLKYIYESTHPVVEERDDSSSGDERNVKKRKIFHDFNRIRVVGDLVKDGEELIFETKQSKRVASCRIPLQIVWHNFLESNSEIRQNLLLYEPLELNLLHKMLKSEGFHFNITDLLNFLDKHCITVRIPNKRRNCAGKKT